MSTAQLTYKVCISDQKVSGSNLPPPYVVKKKNVLRKQLKSKQRVVRINKIVKDFAYYMKKHMIIFISKHMLECRCKIHYTRTYFIFGYVMGSKYNFNLK